MFIIYDTLLLTLKMAVAFLLNTEWSAEELDKNLPARNEKDILLRTTSNSTSSTRTDIAKEIGLGNSINSVLQAAFFKLANIIPIDEAVDYMKAAIKKTYGKKGEDILNMNYAAVDQGVDKVVEVKVPAEWANAVDEAATAAKDDT